MKSEPVMKEAPVKSLAPITFRITADVKPKPIVAEIKVPASSITMSTLGSTAPQVERKSRFPFPPVKVPPPPPAPLQVHPATIINVDEAESVDESSSPSPRLSPVAAGAAGGDFDLNTAMILSTAPESPEDSPTFTTALSLLAPTTTTNTSTNTSSQGSSPTPDPSLLASLLQRAGVATTASTMHQLYYPGQLVHQLQQIQHVQQLPQRRDDAWDGEEKEDRGRDQHSGQAVDQDRGNASGDGLAASGEDWREGGDLWKFQTGGGGERLRPRPPCCGAEACHQGGFLHQLLPPPRQEERGLRVAGAI